MPRKNKKGARGAQRRSHIVREIEKLQSKKKRRKDKSAQSPQASHKGGQSQGQSHGQNQGQAHPPRRGAQSGGGHASHSSGQGHQSSGGGGGGGGRGQSRRHASKQGGRKGGRQLPQPPSRNQKKSSYPSTVDGRLDINPNGFAFVIPDNPEHPHVYIPQGDFREYMNRDKVQVKITRVFDDGKVSGQLLTLLKHQQNEFIGTVRLFAGGRWVIPFDARDRHLTFEIQDLPPNFEVKNNQTVLCKVLEYPTKSRGKVNIVQAVDDVEKAHNDTLRILVQAAWPREFSGQAVREAEEASKNWEKRFGGQIRDVMHIPFVTIDGADARDFDDAVYAVRKGTSFELWVAIADVTRFVMPGSRLNEEAYAKSTSVYFPDFVVPMLPEVLSNGTCSLNPNEPRPALIVRMDIDAQGETRNYEFFEGKILSHRRMTYEEMEDYVEKRATDYPKKLSDSFDALIEVSHRFLGRRKKRGGLDLDIPEARVFLNKDGSVRDIQVRQRLFAHRLIEECMLAANRSAANFLHKRGPSLFRVHEKPNPRKVEDLIGFLSLMGIPPPAKLETTEDFAQFLDDLNANEDVAPAKKKAVNSQILRSMAQARYAAEPLGHFALNEIDYTHFTSPIRRYPDLIVHRLIRAYLEQNKRALLSEDDLTTIGRHTSDCERQAIDMERKVIDIKKCRYVEGHLGEVFKCTVTGVTEKGLFCQIQDHYVDGLLDSENLARRSYFFDGTMAFRGPHHAELTYGAELVLRLDKVDVLQGRINYGWGEEK